MASINHGYVDNKVHSHIGKGNLCALWKKQLTTSVEGKALDEHDLPGESSSR